LQDADRGGCFFVGTDFGVGDPGVIIDDGMDERGPDLRVTLDGMAGP